MARYYNLGPWVYDTTEEPVWRGPEGTVGLFDMRPSAAQTRGFFATDRKLNDAAYVEIGDGADLRQYHTTQAERDAWRSALGLTLSQMPDTITLLRDVLVKTFEELGDPDWGLRFKPPTATRAGNVEFWLGGHSLLSRKPFAVLPADAQDRILSVVRKDVAEQFRLCNLTPAQAKQQRVVAPDRNLYRRYLTALMQKYPVADYKLLIPADLRDHIEPPLPRSTTITDDFADTALLDLASHLGDQGWSWPWEAAAERDPADRQGRASGNRRPDTSASAPSGSADRDRGRAG